jgi:hypothetical protein
MACSTFAVLAHIVIGLFSPSLKERSELCSFGWAIALASNTLNTPVSAKMWRVTPWLFFGYFHESARARGVRRVNQTGKVYAEQVPQQQRQFPRRARELGYDMELRKIETPTQASAPKPRAVTFEYIMQFKASGDVTDAQNAPAAGTPAPAFAPRATCHCCLFFQSARGIPVVDLDGLFCLTQQPMTLGGVRLTGQFTPDGLQPRTALQGFSPTRSLRPCGSGTTNPSAASD